MKIFDHFISTKFNLRIFNGLNNDPDWLEYRFKLFDQFCYPSIRGQSNQNFKWIVYFDSQTPEIFKKKFEKYSEWKNFISVYIDGHISRKISRKIIISNLTPGVEYLITTRIDSDDAICKDFVENIQKNFEYQRFEFISFPYAHVLHPSGKLYSFRYLNNPFVSIIEKIIEPNLNGVKTIGRAKHTEFSKLGNMKQIKSKYSWLQIVHGKNVSNTIRGIRQPMNDISREFSINSDLFYVTQDNLLFYSMDWIVSIIKSSLRAFVLGLPIDVKSLLLTRR